VRGDYPPQNTSKCHYTEGGYGEGRGITPYRGVGPHPYHPLIIVLPLPPYYDSSDVTY